MDKGSTRWVLLIFGLALKFPSLYSWRQFLRGLLSNLQEVEFSKVKEMQHKLCPIYFYIPLGFLIVMPKARVLVAEEWSKDALREFCVCDLDYSIPAEYKCESFGYLNGKLVAIDYGN